MPGDRMDEREEILIIDDDEGTRKTLTFILKKKGFGVISAGTGHDGLELAKGRKVAVALLDINLPDIEGIRLIAPLKEMHPGLPVIMITGFASMENAMRALNEGATGYVLKPVNIDEILAKINDALERQHLIKNKMQAEDALRVSEEKYRSLVENINDAIYSLDEHGVITYISPAIEKISGYFPSHLTGHHFTVFILKDDLPGVVRTFEAAKTGKIASYEFRIVTKSGDEIWLSSSSYPSFANEEFSGVQGVLSDITERKWAENALRESEERYRQLVDNTDTGFVVIDDKGTVWEANEPYLHLIGAEKREDVVGHSVIEWTAPEAADRNAVAVSSCVRDGFIQDFETVYLHRNGSHIHIIINATLHETQDGKRIVSFCRNITERKRAEEALARSYAVLKGVIESPREVVIFALDPQYRYIAFNENHRHTMKQIWGADIALGASMPEIMRNPDDRKKALINFDRALSGESFTLVEEYGDTALERRWYENTYNPITEENGNIIGLTLFLNDITERKQAEQALRESEQKFREIFDNANDGIEIVEIKDDGTPGRFIDLNAVACKMVHYTKEELLKLSLFDIDTENFSRPFDEIMRDVHTVGHARFETEHRRKDGVIFPVEVNSHIVTILGRRVILSIVRDITERRQAEELQRHFTEELEQQVKTRTQELETSLDEKVILLREVHHRVKNNLQIIISLVNLQMRKLEDPLLKQVMAETQNRVRAMSLVHEKLYQSESLSRIDFADYTHFLATQLMSYYGIDPRRVRLDFAMDTIMVDINTAVPLGLLMNELISNALKHAFPNGREGTISVSGSDEKNLITLAVRDNGIGIPEELDWKNPATLGMRLVTSLVDQIDGTIALDRENGTVWTITVKRDPDTEANRHE
jgi:PAS domain S-box-containing protein